MTLTGLDTTKAYTVGVSAINAKGDGAEKVVTLAPTSLPVSPASLITVVGASVALSGQIVRVGSGPVLGDVAFLEQRPAGTTQWSRVASIKTDTAGAWRYTVKPQVNTAYRINHPGSYGMWPAVSALSTITVRYAVTVTPSAMTTTANRAVTFTGTVRPAGGAVTASLQRYTTDGEWVTIQSAAVTAGGTYSIARAFAKGTWNLRVVATGGGVTNAYGFTSAVRLTVN